MLESAEYSKACSNFFGRRQVGGEGFASLAFFSFPERPAPILVFGEAQRKIRSLAANAIEICNFELFAAVATIYRLRDDPWVSSVASCGSSRAALTKGAARNKVALILAPTMWAVAARDDIAYRVERAPAKANPAYLLSRNQQLSFGTDPKKI